MIKGKNATHRSTPVLLIPQHTRSLKMKYTGSIDGKMRTTVKLSLRITKEELRSFNRFARTLGYRSFAEWAQTETMIIYDNAQELAQSEPQ
jgi:hypothetical protein